MLDKTAELIAVALATEATEETGVDIALETSVAGAIVELPGTDATV